MTKKELIDQIKDYGDNEMVKIFSLDRDMDYSIKCIEYNDDMEPNIIYLVADDE